jgi:ketosteroid isomerase-like protein
MSRLLALLLVLAITAGCSDPDSPEMQVRRTLDSMEAAAEARDVGDLMEFIADDFRDGYGQGGEELRRYVQGYFIANQSIHLLTRIDSIEFPHPDEARLHVTLGMAGREADAASAWNLATDLQEFEVTMRKQDDEWKVIHAKRADAPTG